jgi:tetratricopeptide (TPR) repeat protein
MARRSWLRFVAVAVLIALAGCGPGIRRAPVETIPEDADSEDRIDALESMKSDYPGDAYLYLELGKAYDDMASAYEARRNYQKALDLDPELNSARVRLAMLFAESVEMDSARVMLEEALMLDPADPEAHTGMGMIYYAELDVDRAVKHYLKALELDPENVDARYNLGLAFAETGLLLEAVREWRKIVELAPESTEAERAKISLERIEKMLDRKN